MNSRLTLAKFAALWAIGGALSCRAALAQPPADDSRASPISGMVKEATSGQGVANVAVSEVLGGFMQQSVQTLRDGSFLFANPQSLPPGERWIELVTDVAGFAPTMTVVAPDAPGPVQILLRRGGQVRVQVLDSSGHPVPNARVSIERVFQAPPDVDPTVGRHWGWPSWTPDALSQGVLTDVSGAAVLTQLPQQGVGELVVAKSGFAPTRRQLNLGREPTLQVNMVREVVVEGTIFLDGEHPADAVPLRESSNLSVKIQPPWQVVSPEADGSFRLGEISMQYGNSRMFNINLDGTDQEKPPIDVARNLTAHYRDVSFDQEFVFQQGAAERRWVGYVENLTGLKPGDILHHDIHLVPLAHLIGTVKGLGPAVDAGFLQVWCDDPRATKGTAHAPCDAAGHFELWVPMTATHLYFGPREQHVTASAALAPLRAFEVRNLIIDVSPGAVPTR